MKTLHTLMTVLAAGVLGGVCVTQAHGAPPLVIETVTVGNPGNAGDTQNQGIFGVVDYVYAIGKYEVTAGQYAAFLDAVAASRGHGRHERARLRSRGPYFDWDPRLGGSGTLYDLVRGDLANLSGNASAVDLGPLTCIENDSDDESSQADPDTDVLAPNTGFFYLVRFEEGSVIGPWGFGSEGEERAGTGGCPPWPP